MLGLTQANKLHHISGLEIRVRSAGLIIMIITRTSCGLVGGELWRLWREAKKRRADDGCGWCREKPAESVDWLWLRVCAGRRNPIRARAARLMSLGRANLRNKDFVSSVAVH